jgi:hypothetical protein
MIMARIARMDFFETQERYRRREMRGWLVLFVRIALIVGALWFGWLWGQAEQSSLQAEADLVIYENNVRITELSTHVQNLQRELAETRADGTAKSITGDDNAPLRRIIARKIATGVTSEQITSSIQSLGKPENCRKVARNDVAVATPLYAGPESKLTLFGGGLNLSVEGSAGKQAQRDTPWFDPTLPVSVRHVFLGGQKTISGLLPLDAIIPTEDWILKLRYEKAGILGYVTAIVSSCTLR